MAETGKNVDSTGWSASAYNNTASFVYSAQFTTPVMDLLKAQQGERIIDFGCGSGEVTLEIQREVGQSGVVVGVDASESMIEQSRVNGLEHVFVSDLQEPLIFPDNFQGPKERYDAVFSNAALHWCKQDPRAVLDNARKILRQGGRLVGEMGGFMNVVGVRSSLHAALKKRGHNPAELDPWYFPSVEDYEELLKQAHFHPVHVSLHPRYTPLSKGGLTAWLHLFVRHTFLGGFSDAETEEIIQEVEDICKVDCMDRSGKWGLMYMRLRFVAIVE